VGERRVRECTLHGGERRLGLSPAVDQAEVPVVDVDPAAVPLVGPGEDEGAGAAGRVGRAELTLEHPRLRALSVPPAVKPELGDQKRSISRDVVEAPEIGLQELVGLEVDVEADQVEKRELEILGRGIVDVGDEGFRIDGLDRRAEPLDEALDAAASMPPDNRCGNLVADRVAEKRGMSCACPGASLDTIHDPLGLSPVIEKCDVLLPVEADHGREPLVVGEVEQPSRWSRVEADGVRPGRGDCGEITGYRRGVGIGHVAGERPVRDPPDVLLLRVDLEKAPLHVRATSTSLGSMPLGRPLSDPNLADSVVWRVDATHEMRLSLAARVGLPLCPPWPQPDRASIREIDGTTQSLKWRS
jgi:hypothetical protein